MPPKTKKPIDHLRSALKNARELAKITKTKKPKPPEALWGYWRSNPDGSWKLVVSVARAAVRGSRAHYQCQMGPIFYVGKIPPPPAQKKAYP